MTQTRMDLPWNFPTDWDVPTFQDGEMPALVMAEGERIISAQRALVYGNINKGPIIGQLKKGIACYRLGYLFETNRKIILAALREQRGEKGGDR